MKRSGSATEQLSDDHASATAKVRLWQGRAVKARQAGRTADAERCEDKVRDWISRLRQIERSQKQNGPPGAT
jgi:hypothetical protein